ANVIFERRCRDIACACRRNGHDPGLPARRPVRAAAETYVRLGRVLFAAEYEQRGHPAAPDSSGIVLEIAGRPGFEAKRRQRCLLLQWEIDPGIISLMRGENLQVIITFRMFERRRTPFFTYSLAWEIEGETTGMQ